MPVCRTLLQGPNGVFQESVPLSQLSEMLADEASTLWIDLERPTPEEVDLLGKELGLHDLTQRELSRGHPRARVQQFGSYVHIVFFAIEGEREREVDLCIGKNYLVTVHFERLEVIEETATRWRRNAGRMEAGVGVLVYSLLDAIVDGYFPALDGIAERLESVDELIFSGRREAQGALRDLFAIKRELLDVRRALSPERDVLNVLLRRDTELFGKEMEVYLQDVYDHIIRVLDSIDLYRDQLSTSLDAYLSVISNRLNSTMKRMTALATILMSMTFIASIYGMNFHVMPELDWPLGYAWALGLMAVTGGSLTLLFRRIDWL
jgi:magnesium transporter